MIRTVGNNQYKVIISKGIKPRIVNKMISIVDSHVNGDIYFRKMEHGKFTVYNVGNRHRIVCMKGVYYLLTHETYNNFQCTRCG